MAGPGERAETPGSERRKRRWGWSDACEGLNSCNWLPPHPLRVTLPVKPGDLAGESDCSLSGSLEPRAIPPLKWKARDSRAARSASQEPSAA